MIIIRLCILACLSKQTSFWAGVYDKFGFPVVYGPWEKTSAGPGLWERPKSSGTPKNILEQCVEAKPGRTHMVLFRLWQANVLKPLGMER